MVVDSSVWLEILTDGPRAAKCHKILQNKPLRVPTLVLHEVYKKLCVRAGESLALEGVASLCQYEVLNLTREVAILAGDLCLSEKIRMADGMVLAHARLLNDTLVTLDHDFVGKDGAMVLR